MKFLLLLALSSFAQAENLPCPPAPETEPLLYSDEFKWGASLEEMRAKFTEIYASGKRLKGRAYWSPEQKTYLVNRETGPVKVGTRFLRNITRHIEISLERRYADFLFFPDMGHSHFYIPEALWPELNKIPLNQQHILYEKMLALPELKILYHTAEQLAVRDGKEGRGAFPQDKVLLWRYFTRNPIGDNRTGENIAPQFAFKNESYNTVSELSGYHSWSAGFSVSASKDGCFSFRAPDGKILRFDLSLEDLPYNGGDGD